MSLTLAAGLIRPTLHSVRDVLHMPDGIIYRHHNWVFFLASLGRRLVLPIHYVKLTPVCFTTRNGSASSDMPIRNNVLSTMIGMREIAANAQNAMAAASERPGNLAIGAAASSNSKFMLPRIA
jgi:hypothetical protein